MSGIAGCHSFDGAGVPAEIAATLHAGITQCGSDGNVQLDRGPAVLIQCPFFTGLRPEPAQHFERDGISIVWDGRIDGREALSARAGVAAGSDAELILELYRRDRDGAFVADVIGDFAFALFDACSASTASRSAMPRASREPTRCSSRSTIRG